MTIAQPATVKDREETDREPESSASERFLAPTVFVTGSAVLTLEVLGTRLLSPHFGSNLYVWSALISVTLVALSLGYWIGGRVADSQGRPLILDAVIAASAVWVAVIPDLVRVFTGSTSGLEYRAAILSTAIVAFGPALFLLGTITPIAVKLTVSDLGHVGRSAGAIYAYSTAGGIAGALASGFILFPTVSIGTACHLTALILFALAAGRWIAREKSKRIAAVLMLPVLAATLAFPSAFRPESSWQAGEFRIVANYPSYYGPVRIVDGKGARLLIIDGLCHNAIDVETGRSIMPHLPLFELLPYIRPEASDALLVGVGGGDIPKALLRGGIRTTGVELDPVVVDAARRHLGLREAVDKVVVGDGRVYMAEPGPKFDLVILDAFLGGSIPAHLFSIEGLKVAKSRLRDGGLLAINMLVLPGDTLIASLESTLRQAFTHVTVLRTYDVNGEIANAALYASDQPLELPSNWSRPPSPELQALLDAPGGLDALRRAPGQGRIITDAHNFLDRHSARIDRALRLNSQRILPASVLIP